MVITRSLIVAEARAWIGTPYRHQASLKGVGCDCLGLVRGVWRAVMGTEPERAPPYAPDWAEAAGRETLAEAAGRHMTRVPLNEFAPGDVLLFRWRAEMPAKHAAIVTASDKMVHAHDGAAVAEVAIAPWWRRRLAYAFRFPGLTEIRGIS
jgi:NlpC/P60 family putative phage cell wall peptidase